MNSCHAPSPRAARAAVAIALLGVLAGPGSAAALVFTESTHGELSSSGTLRTLALDAGVNTVSGQIYYAAEIDFDSFAFTVPPGHFVQSASVVTRDAIGDFYVGRWALNAGTDLFSNGTLLELLEPAFPSDIPFTAVPLGAGLYNLSQYGLFAAVNSVGDYTFTFTVVSACDWADTNCDGAVDLADIPNLLAALLEASPPCAPCSGDANSDGRVDGSDVQAFCDRLLNP